ncbi:MAG: 30S ribosomal protein S6--L-glutamate ligase, partial [Planctomycetota bacterium]
QRRSIVIQRFVEESRGVDRRLFVVGDAVVAAVKRVAAEHEFRANRHRGGQVERFTPDPDSAALAVRAAQSLGLEIAGIDLLASTNGPLLLEANASPGLEGIEAGSGSDVAAAVVSHVVARASERV